MSGGLMAKISSKLKFYLSDFILGYGRFVVITTAQYVKDSKDIAAETFVLCLDSEGIFKGSSITYAYRDGDEKIANFDLPYMENEALGQAKLIIHKLQLTKYKETKDLDYFKKDYEFHECKSNVLISLKNIANYNKELKKIANLTKNNELKDYLKLILSFPKFTIKPYE
jgi:hypothetical protein